LAGAVAFTASVPACSSGSGGPADASIDGIGVLPGDDATGPSEGGDDGPPALSSSMRLAHASPDLGPTDFCWRPHGASAYTGPVLAATATGDGGATSEGGAAGEGGAAEGGPDGGAGADAGDAAGAGDGAGGLADAALDAAPLDASIPLEAATGEGGAGDASTADGGSGDGATGDGGPVDAGPSAASALVFGAMTGVVKLPTAGTFDVALVTAGQASCYPATATGQVTLDANKRATVVILGLVGADGGPSALAFKAFADAPVDPQLARVRLIHAALGSPDEAPAPPLTVTDGTAVFAAELDPAHAAAPSKSPPIDALGYATLDALTGAQSLLLAAATDASPAPTWTSQPRDLHVQTGTAHTGIVVSLDHGALGIAYCDDAATSAPPWCILVPAPH